MEAITTMVKPRKIVIAGMIFAIAIAIVGVANSVRLEANLRQIESECVEEGKRDKTPDDWVLVCDADSLLKDSSSFVKGSIQAKIVQAYNNSRSSRKWPYVVATFVFVLSAVPWTWYFLLRRIREIRDAVAGKDIQ